MTSLTLMITRVGQARFTAAQLDADINFGIAEVGLTDVPFVSAPTLEALPGEFKRLASISGEQVGDNIVHMTIRDDSADGYTARGFGLFLADGTLFATYAQADRLFEKSPRATFLAAIDIAFPTGDVSDLRFGNTDFLNPPATTATKGVVELATQAEADAGTDMRRVPPVSVMRASIASAIATFSATFEQRISAVVASIAEALEGLAARTVYGSGLVSGGGRNDTNRTLTVTAATTAQVRDGFATDVVVTPKALADALILRVLESTETFRSLSDGTIEQWGTHAVPANEGAFELVFPRPFPEKCYGVFCTVLNAGGSTSGQTTIQETSLQADRAKLFVQNHQTTNNDAAGFRWRAWGR
ncbi:hypothetical protein [Sphingomonas sp. Leaf226]|uniref:gp53-like domain-containing protein n=1 Tax=Sphingomonas sp. Leaf226 TaxID=1735691 RepID=UPI000B0A1507|nr:hypothetical protein [Sphingomonas sp. Leaf226]